VIYFSVSVKRIIVDIYQFSHTDSRPAILIMKKKSMCSNTDAYQRKRKKKDVIIKQTALFLYLGSMSKVDTRLYKNATLKKTVESIA